MSLFTPFTIKNVTFKNRIVVSPMCQYSSHEGFANEWHLVHLGSRAVGGAGLVMMEATAITPQGRISPDDMGIWSDSHIEALKPITRFIQSQGAVAGIQLAHAGRKASTYAPTHGNGAIPTSKGGWQTLAPSSLAFDPTYGIPQSMTIEEIQRTVEDFAQAAQRAWRAGFKVIEIHAAHGYLLHQFLSPLSNQRMDAYGGSLENRMRFPLEVVQAVRKVWPENFPLFLRISATDWAQGGWTLEESIQFSRQVQRLGVDVMDVSSGGLVPYAKITLGPGYQVPFALKIKEETGIGTMAVGMITDPAQADAIIREGKADLVALARAFLRNPYWVLNAAQALEVEIPCPRQYVRAKPFKP